MKPMKKTINLPERLHQAVKIESAKQNLAMEAYIAKCLWTALGSTINEVKR